MPASLINKEIVVNTVADFYTLNASVREKPINGQILKVLGYYSPNDGGGQSVIYRSTGKSGVTIDNGFYFNGFSVDDYFEALDKSVADARRFGAKADWVYPFTGTDNTSIFINVKNAAESHKSLFYIPRGEYRFTSPMDWTGDINIDAGDACLRYTAFTSAAPLVTVGGNTSPIFLKRQNIPCIGCVVQGQHNYPEENRNIFAALRVKDASGCVFNLHELKNCYIGLQLFPSPTSAVAHCIFNAGEILTSKICIDLRGNVGVGWVNENTFIAQNITESSSIHPYGTAYGVRFSSEPGGYDGQNNNKFYSTCFQMSDIDPNYQWSASKPNVYLGYRYEYQGREYKVTAVTPSPGTLGVVPPTHTSGAVTSNGVELTYIGKFWRVPVFCDGAGGANIFHGARWESGYGPFMLINPTRVIDANEAHVYFTDDNEWLSQNSWRAIDSWTHATTATDSGRNTITAYGNKQHDVLSVSDIHLRTIVSGSTTVIPGICFFDVDNWTPLQIDPAAAIICKDYVKLGFGTDYAGVIISCEKQKRFSLKIEARAEDIVGYAFKPFDDSLSPLAVSDSVRNLIGGISQIVIVEGGGYPASGGLGGGLSEEVCVIPEGVPTKWVAVLIDDRTAMQGFKIEAIQESIAQDIYGTAHTTSGIKTYHKITDQRYCNGTPTSGIFQNRGEIINDISGVNDYFIVETAGALAPAWVSGTTVIRGELRQNAGHIYSAVAAGSSGTVAPTHTSGSANGWDYYSTQAVLTPKP